VTREAPIAATGNLPATKFALPPAQAAIIVRARLLAALDDGIRRPLTLISAPPGAGKTALLGSWIGAGRAPGPVAWLSLDAADGDRRRFWRAVLEALARAGVTLTEPADHAHGRPDPDKLAAALDERDDPVVLVLDDFHEVAESVHRDLDRLLHRPPRGLRLVIATRADPPLRLGRLRLQDQLTELREPDLAMTLDETAEMLDAAGVCIAREHVCRLWEHTEGWAGALRLASLPLRDHPDPGAFVEHFAGDDRAISDYLISEVLSGMTRADRVFLLRTSIVTVLNGDLADALTGDEGGHRHLADLARGGLLLTSLDRRGEWYRYHALFRELLQAELRSDAASELPELHRRAALWLADSGDDAAGLRHAVDAGAWSLAARLAGERWIDLLLRGEVGALRPLIDRLPEVRVDEEPEVALAVASAQLDHGDHAEAAKLLALAEAASDRVPVERCRRFKVSLSALELHVARLKGDLAAAVETGGDLSQGGELDAGEVDAGLRSLALVNLGIAELWTGALDSAERHLERARGAAAEAGHDWVVLIAIAHLATLSGARHDFSRASNHARQAIDLATRRGWQRTWPAGAAYLALGGAQFLWDRGDEAAGTVELAREALAGTHERPLRAVLALLRSAVLGDRGDLEAALAVVEAGAEELGDYPLLPEVRDHFAIREAMLRAQLGDREQAARLMRGEAGPGTLRQAVVIAQFQLADGNGEDARETLAPWSDQRMATLEGVQARVVEALACESASDPEGAAKSLELALDLAEPGGLRLALVQFGRPLQPLLSRQLRRGTAHRALVGDLLEALDGTDGRTRASAPLVVEPLSPREQAVLRYLPTMMSNQEIASELFVSVNTVKTHLKAIYRKLDVADRREAVRRARKLELLAP
jgi:LuxR family transcriptional regulator, maltose regulon positive regulatory protein